MKHIAKTVSALLLSSALVLSLSACGGGQTSSTPSPAEDESGTARITLRVGASPAPHAEILEQVKPALAEQGIDLEVVEFTDYVIPNTALQGGDLDANYFQHTPYLEQFNASNGTDLVPAASIHFEPLGVYPGKTATLEELPDGAEIVIPNDTSNEARALLLLEAQGVIKLKDGVGLEATPKDVVENPKNVKFIEAEAAQTVRMLPDANLAVINGNYAVEAGITDTVLVTEERESDGAQTYANVVAVRRGDETRPEIQSLISALESDTVRDYINTNYDGAVVPLF